MTPNITVRVMAIILANAMYVIRCQGEDIIIESTLHDQAFQILSDEMKKTIFSELKTVATLSELNRRFIEILHSTGIPAEQIMRDTHQCIYRHVGSKDK